MKKFRKVISLLITLSILALTNIPSMATAASDGDSTTRMRMQPIVDKYNSLTQEELNNEVAKYRDINNHWGVNYISKISALEIISGYPDGRFGPNDKLLGGQYILMLMRAIGYRPEVPQGVPYYKPFVDIALQEGIVTKGEISDYTKPITRELAASLARRTIAKYEKVPTDYFIKGTDTEGKGDKGFFDNVYVGYQKLKMTDYPNITSKYLQDVIDCYRIGLLTGSNNKFNPKGTLTRAEASVIIIKLIDKNVRVESVPGANESFTFKNLPSMDLQNGYCSDETGRYENKNYLLYKGLFPMMEIWDTVYAMEKNKSKITSGACNFGYGEKTKFFGMGWFIDAEVEEKFRMDNEFGIIVPQNSIDVYTNKASIKKGQKDSLWDNARGSLYDVYSSDVDNYNKALKTYVYELMKVWFGSDYDVAKKLHDQYLGYSLKDEAAHSGYYLINGRQVYFAGGRDLGGRRFCMEVWAKGFITKDTMYKR